MPESDSRYCWCGIYTRQSREAGGVFSSCDAQFAACFQFIRAKFSEGWVCNGHRYDENGESSEGLDRPALSRLLSDIEAGRVDRVVVHRLDRLSRHIGECTALLQQLRDRGVPVSIVTSPALGLAAEHTFALNILASFAEFEREMTRERFADASAALKAQGRRVAGVVPYGYRTDPVTKQLVLEPREARSVGKMFGWAAEGKTPTEIAAIANNRRWRTKAGGRWTPRQILATLSNPVYAGLVRDGDAVRPGVHPAVVDMEVFDRAQAEIAARRTRKPGRDAAKVAWPLRGLLFCGRCDRVMSPSISVRGNVRYRYHRCRSQVGGQPPCRGVSVPAFEIEQYVLDVLRDVDTRNGDERSGAEAVSAARARSDGSAAGLLLPARVERVVLDPAREKISVSIRSVPEATAPPLHPPGPAGK